MKALILAAGYGTRLKPYTDTLPKPLFPIDGRPLLDIHIEALQRAGCEAVAVNTHHLHHLIAEHVQRQDYGIPVQISYEPSILGTGGAIKKVADFWDERPFVVVNSDIVTDIDLQGVYRFHCRHAHPATLVLHDDPQFNSVGVNTDGYVIGFVVDADGRSMPEKMFTFTGIQVLDPSVLNEIPERQFFSSIEAYRNIIRRGGRIRAFINRDRRWLDIGTPANYRRAVMTHTAPLAFRHGLNVEADQPIEQTLLKGDGSDRRWYRLTCGPHRMIMADHGIRPHPGTTEADAMLTIGNHLYRCGLPVPKIFYADTFSGMVFMQDLGDKHLQQVYRTASAAAGIQLYRKVIRVLVKMAVGARKGFDTSWTCQTAYYDKNLILEKECRYFVEAFLQGYLQIATDVAEYQPDFELLADQALRCGHTGFVHRDFQSRNIMVTDDRVHVIDFQGGRLGPVQYDLASLLIDPYVQLDPDVQEQLLTYAVARLQSLEAVDADRFKAGYRYCRITRNLQILGAFAFLSRAKGKAEFEAYIAPALQSLARLLESDEGRSLPRLQKRVREIMRDFPGS